MMYPLRKIKSSKQLRFKNGLMMDDLTISTMKSLNLHMFKSSIMMDKTLTEEKARQLDKAKALKLYGDKVDMSQYAVHHLLRGLVGLAPIEVHSTHGHYGLFKRLKLSA